MPVCVRCALYQNPHRHPKPWEPLTKKNTNTLHILRLQTCTLQWCACERCACNTTKVSGNNRSKITRMMVIFTWYSGMDTIIASALTACLCLVFCCCCWWRDWSWCCVGIGVVHLTSHHPGTQIKCKVKSPILHVLLVFGEPKSPDIFHMCFLPEIVMRMSLKSQHSSSTFKEHPWNPSRI